MQRFLRGCSIRVGHALLACLLVLGLVAEAAAQVRVKGYTRKDGTYVAPHYRSAPNSSKSDNYSTKGNYNPYTGERGSVKPYPSDSYSSPAYAPRVTYTAPAYPSAYVPSAPRPMPGVSAPAYSPPLSVYRCVGPQGELHYLSYPRNGCDEIQVLNRQQAAAQPMPLRSFGGYACTSDCSGHEAGYAWAEENGIDDPDNCGGNSQSFIEGCEAYAEEQ